MEAGLSLRHYNPKQNIDECTAECCAYCKQHINQANKGWVKFKVIGKSTTNTTQYTIGGRTLNAFIHCHKCFDYIYIMYDVAVDLKVAVVTAYLIAARRDEYRSIHATELIEL